MLGRLWTDGLREGALEGLDPESAERMPPLENELRPPPELSLREPPLLEPPRDCASRIGVLQSISARSKPEQPVKPRMPVSRLQETMLSFWRRFMPDPFALLGEW